MKQQLSLFPKINIVTLQNERIGTLRTLMEAAHTKIKERVRYFSLVV
jgi:hypothetical protein